MQLVQAHSLEPAALDEQVLFQVHLLIMLVAVVVEVLSKARLQVVPVMEAARAGVEMLTVVMVL